MYIITTNGYHERPDDWIITMLNSMPAYLSATNYSIRKEDYQWDLLATISITSEFVTEKNVMYS